MSKLNSLEDLLTEEIEDLYSAETQLIKALPRLATVASYSGLVESFEAHLEEMKLHVERLQQFADLLAITSSVDTRKSFDGFVGEAAETPKEIALGTAA